MSELIEPLDEGLEIRAARLSSCSPCPASDREERAIYGGPKGQTTIAPSPRLQEAIDAIRGWHRRRCYAMEQRKRADLSLGSFLRLVLGWSKALPDAERKAINDHAKALIALGEAEMKAKGEPFLSDDPDYHDWRDVILASLQARAPFDMVEKEAKAEMAKLARTLPVYPWASRIKGFGDVSLAVIVAEAGDLSDYPAKGHLWKRMGVAVLDGVRQGGLKKAAAKDDWIAHGYNRQRRSRMWNIGDALIKSNGDGEYRDAYLSRKVYERERAEAAGLTVAPAAKIPAKRADEYMSEGHIHRRAQRCMEKRLLRDLWQAWRRASSRMSDETSVPLPVAAE